MTTTEILNKLMEKFPGAVVALEEQPENYIPVVAEQWLPVAEFLCNEPDLEFDSLQCITGVDLGEDQNLEVRYNLHSMKQRHKVEIIISVARKRPSIPSIEKIWRIGDWFEREVYDMFGIRFKGHRDLRRMLLPEDWVGWPLRKDYKTPKTYHGIMVPKVKEGWQ